MSDEVLIKVQGVKKKFCRSLKRSLWYGLCDVASELNPLGARQPADPGLEATLRAEEFWAVNDVSFELRRGECLGLIGRNGAGKTTLLKMLNGLIKPDAGRIEMRGRVGALIALGAGFNPVLTGRENIYINASILGLTKQETDAKLDEIVEFSEIGEFIDTPVQNYSSGMQVRLGFSTAASLSPDILILDEVLAVGDRAFQLKCMTRVGEMMKDSAVIFVSHQMELLSHISTAGLVMQSGRQLFAGKINEALRVYAAAGSGPRLDQWIHSTPGISAVSVTLLPKQIRYRGTCSLAVDFTSAISLDRAVARICFEDETDRVIAEWNSTVHGTFFPLKVGANHLVIELENLPLGRGEYRLNFNLQPPQAPIYLISANHCEVLKVNMDVTTLYAVQI